MIYWAELEIQILQTSYLESANSPKTRSNLWLLHDLSVIFIKQRQKSARVQPKATGIHPGDVTSPAQNKEHLHTHSKCFSVWVFGLWEETREPGENPHKLVEHANFVQRSEQEIHKPLCLNTALPLKQNKPEGDFTLLVTCVFCV